ncbi:DUF3147 family protein [Sulfurimonas sp.]|uniref:DUF3147 family protein n=1 Tax=Sulfurimonas sp. TaxID=2022749 RepID=UPI002B47DCA6|nr:DUF3147 family protein [Sulfurimonas sp.]
MGYYILKILISAILIVIISEVSKRNSLFAGIVASLPLVSILAMIWLYIDTKDVAKVSELSSSIFWFVIPSLALFISLPIFLKYGFSFYSSLFFSSFITIGCYYLMILVLDYFRINM